jgi:hypothetical protein
MGLLVIPVLLLGCSRKPSRNQEKQRSETGNGAWAAAQLEWDACSDKDCGDVVQLMVTIRESRQHSGMPRFIEIWQGLAPAPITSLPATQMIYQEGIDYFPNCILASKDAGGDLIVCGIQGGPAYRIAAYSWMGATVVKTLDETSRSMPEFVHLDKTEANYAIVLADHVSKEGPSFPLWEPSTARIYIRDRKRFVLKAQVPWEKRFEPQGFTR